MAGPSQAASAAAPSNTPSYKDTPISTILIGVYIEFLVGFREETHDGNHAQYVWLAQRLPVPDTCPPAIYLPVRRHGAQFDPFLVDVSALEVGQTLAMAGFVPAQNRAFNADDPYNVRLSDPFTSPLRPLMVCATPSNLYINTINYVRTPAADLWDSFL